MSKPSGTKILEPLLLNGLSFEMPRGEVVVVGVEKVDVVVVVL